MGAGIKDDLGDTQDRYTPDPGTLDKNVIVLCGVCNEAMNAKFGIRMARGFAQAMAGGSSECDCYLCPNREEDWHKQAIALREEARKTPSAHLEKIFRDEADKVIETKECTKAWYSFC